MRKRGSYKSMKDSRNLYNLRYKFGNWLFLLDICPNPSIPVFINLNQTFTFPPTIHLVKVMGMPYSHTHIHTHTNTHTQTPKSLTKTQPNTLKPKITQRHTHRNNHVISIKIIIQKLNYMFLFFLRMKEIEL